MAAMRPCATLPGASHIQLLRPWLHIGGTMSPVTLGGKNCLGWKMKTTTICHGGEIFKTTSFADTQRRVSRLWHFAGGGGASFCEDADLLADLAHWDEKKAAANGEGFSLVYWQNVGLARVGNWLRTSLFERRASGARRHVDEAARQIMAANADSSVCFKFRHTCLRAWRGRLFWGMITPSPPSDFVLPLKAAEADCRWKNWGAL